MTPKQFRNALSELQLSQGQAAKLLGLSIRTVNGYANDNRNVPKLVAAHLKMLIEQKQNLANAKGDHRAP